jgi:hypothetical protein
MLQDPFMSETVQRAAARRVLRHIPVPDLGRLGADASPAGLIFHVARCGSTLVSQMLKQHPHISVYSEPQSFNELLVSARLFDRAFVVAALRSLGGCFARHAGQQYSVKLSSWNTLYCDILCEAFPSTPWALCVRDPVEVCVSLLQQRPGWMRDAEGAHDPLAGLVETAPSTEMYVARTFAAFCGAATRLDPARGLIIAYETLPDAVWTALCGRFGLAVDQDDLRRMAEVALGHAKAPVGRAKPFVPDSKSKTASASPALIEAVEAYARPALQQLIARFGR